MTYSWTLNGTVVGATSTYTVPASAVTGDVIEVTVTDADGNTASDSAIVSGLTIVSVEPTTAAGTNGAGNLIGYKYVRIFFSESLASLDTSEVEIRNVKSKQLYSIESLKLSSTGLFADIILYGSNDADGTTFLMPNTPYVATVEHNGLVDSLEFELPATVADEVVVGVDEDENVIYTQYSERTQAIHYGWTEGAPDVDDYNLGVSYDGNIGELLGRTVNFGFNGDEVITDLTVQDEVVVIDTMKYVDANGNGQVDKKDYFETNDGDKYYFEESNSATKNLTHYILANNSDLDFDATFNPTDGDVFDYVKLVLNPTGTIATVVYNENRTDYLMVESVDDTVVIADKQTSMNFKNYTIFAGDNLISTDDLEVGDVVYYSIPDKFAYVYNSEISGEMDNVIHEKLDIDGTTYKWTNSKYYDTPNKKYVTLTAGTDAQSVASQKYLNSLDPDDVQLVLDMNGGVSYVDGTVVGEAETTTTTYIVADETVQSTVGFDEIIKLVANDGSAGTTLKFNPMDLKSVNGESGKMDTVTPAAGGAGSFSFKPTDNSPGAIAVTPKTDIKYTELIDIVTDNATGDIVGYKELGTLNVGKTTGTAIKITATSSNDKINSTTSKVTDGNGNTYALTASTKIWVVVNKDGTTALDGTKADSIKQYKFSEFSMGTTALADANIVGYVYPDKANAKHIVLVQAKGKEAAAWDDGDETTITGIVVGETFVAKSDGSDTNVVKTITIKDATGTEIALDANGVVTTAVAPGDYVAVTYTDADTKVKTIAESAWTWDSQDAVVTYDSGALELDSGDTVRPASNCLVLQHYTLGGVDYWDPITIGEITSSVNGWTVKYNEVSREGTDVRADFIVVDKDAATRSATSAVAAAAIAADYNEVAQATVTVSDTAAATRTFTFKDKTGTTATAATLTPTTTGANNTAAAATGVVTVTYGADGDTTLTIVYTGTNGKYKRTWVYTVTGATPNITSHTFVSDSGPVEITT